MSLVSSAERNDLNVFRYVKDVLGRLTKVIQPDPDGAGPDLAAFMAYTYDLVGNMLTESDRLSNTTSYTYDNLYRATKVTDANGKDTLFAYDRVGNRLSLTDSVGNTTQWVYGQPKGQASRVQGNLFSR